jgi:hypothetical protein
VLHNAIIYLTYFRSLKILLPPSFLLLFSSSIWRSILSVGERASSLRVSLSLSLSSPSLQCALPKLQQLSFARARSPSPPIPSPLKTSVEIPEALQIPILNHLLNQVVILHLVGSGGGGGSNVRMGEWGAILSYPLNEIYQFSLCTPRCYCATTSLKAVLRVSAGEILEAGRNSRKPKRVNDDPLPPSPMFDIAILAVLTVVWASQCCKRSKFVRFCIIPVNVLLLYVSP